MSAPDRIFRQAALDRLSSPEQLDQLMQVTTPKSWMALAAFGAVLLMALIWGIFGKVADQVHGRGIFLRTEGVFLVAARGEGSVVELLAQHGDSVTNGQLLARILQPELEIKLKHARTNYEGIEVSLQELERTQKSETNIEQFDWTAQRSMLARMITNYTTQITALTARTHEESDLLDKGLISKVQFLDTQNSLYTAQQELDRTKVQLQQVDLAQFQAGARRRQLLAERTDQRQQALQQIDYLSKVATLNTEVRSLYPGQILEVMVKQGDLISAGTPIASLQGTTNELEARLFLSSSDGKRLASRLQHARGPSSSKAPSSTVPSERMEALLAPVSVKKEEYGLMRGEAIDASEYPVTPQGMLRILQNPTLVAEFSQGGAPIEVRVRLSKSTNTESGFEWTSKGPPMAITSGTLCDGTITIDRRAPISLVLPLLKKAARN